MGGTAVSERHKTGHYITNGVELFYVLDVNAEANTYLIEDCRSLETHAVNVESLERWRAVTETEHTANS